MTITQHLGLSATARQGLARTTAALFAGAATIATLALFGAATPSIAEAAPASVSGHIIPVNDDDGWSVNDQGQTSGDTFLQNAQDQSTA